MTNYLIPRGFLRAIRTMCWSCWPNNHTRAEVCPKQTCPFYPFRFGRVCPRSLDQLLNRCTEDATFTTDVFDYDAEWSSVLPVLDHPLVVRALNAGMNDRCDQIGWVWQPDAGPWAFSWGDGWWVDADAKFEASDQHRLWEEWCRAQGCPDYQHDPKGHDEWFDTNREAWEKYSEMEAPFLPQRRTPDWYRCYGASHWLSLWNCAVGELLFPDMLWHVVQGKSHSTAIGVDTAGMMCMDVLWGQDHTFTEIWKAVCDGDWTSLMDAIEWREERPFRTGKAA